MQEAQQKLQTIAQACTPRGSEFDTQGVIEIVGTDLDSSLAFYQQLGFRVERRTGAFAVLLGFGVRVFLAEDPAAPTGNRWANIRLLVSNVDEVWECVSAVGLTIAHPLADRPYGLRDFVVRDPSGFEVRFAQVLR